ncbi:MAG: hypothetical protein F4X02_07120 [Chloroflexi bacterium]|nr:hypothetical protein [Chloroflexota bacterium]
MSRSKVSASDGPSKPQAVLVDPLMDEDPSDDEILESMRRGMEDVKAGRTRPARQAMAEIRKKLAADADSR